MKHFIFGYGSLICPKSRSITAPTLTSAAEPVVINNIKRTWSARVTGVPSNNNPHTKGWTPMGVRVRNGAKCNGVLICVDEEELKRFDIREAGYERHRIDVSNVLPHVETDALIDEQMPLWPQKSLCENEDFQRRVLEKVKCPDCRVVFERGFAKRRHKPVVIRDPTSILSAFEDEAEIAVWVYIQSEDLPANHLYPITQSYLDIIMRGCLSISHDFARRFLETTHGWWHDGKLHPHSSDKITQSLDHHTWVNDRHDPMYIRADSDYSIENGDIIDSLISEHHPEALKRRVLST